MHARVCTSYKFYKMTNVRRSLEVDHLGPEDGLGAERLRAAVETDFEFLRVGVVGVLQHLI